VDAIALPPRIVNSSLAGRSLGDLQVGGGAMSLQRHKQDWEELGRLDPLWAVLSTREGRHGRWDPDAFFATGREEVERLLAVAAEVGHPRERGAVLDFGCGVGRSLHRRGYR
jgi:hypothetical protein